MMWVCTFCGEEYTNMWGQPKFCTCGGELRKMKPEEIASDHDED